MAVDPLVGFFMEAGRLLQDYEDTKARRADDPAAYERACVELRAFRQAMRELSAGTPADGVAHAGLATVAADGQGV